MLKGKGLAVFTLVLVAVILIGWRMMSSQQQRHADIGENVAGVTSGNSDAPAQATMSGKHDLAADNGFSAYLAAAAGLGALPASLEGTDVDGELRSDAQGNLIIGNEIRRVFDYFLATLGEEDIESIKARIALHLHQHLPESAARQAWELLIRYLDYGEALAALPPHDGSVKSMHEVLVQRRDMRTAWLGQEVAEAFFAQDDAFDAYSLARVTVQQDDSLSAEEKQQRQRELEAMLPPEMREARERMRAPVEVAQQVEALRAQGGSEADVRRLREQTFGSAAADRLEQLDRERAAWDQRYADWRAERQAIEQSGLAQEDQARALEDAMARRFSEQEQRRVQALDRIGG
ncbi:lipase chaperone [Isoalcanivorax pacificus W11-5]|uniref:Lipase chaperone n=1 Tax=Isoalcanivorax pacificus W11-5 TaxID=391936 RepID=A0A0B4XQS9_9GAMM|nr:lipase secretion chaperone [Isoalcanivorax pacificus]AJD48587.1 lipase chaperone [Isoalcanivorax pacificus W11-5]